jgi:hypothetical protein
MKGINETSRERRGSSLLDGPSHTKRWRFLDGKILLKMERIIGKENGSHFISFMLLLLWDSFIHS